MNIRNYGRRIALWIACLLVLAPGAMITAARVVHMEYGRGIVVAETALPYLLLPAYVTLIIASVLRQRFLTAVSVVLIAAHLIFVLPEFLATRPVPANVVAQPTFRVFSHNIKFDNETPELLGEDIAHADADVVMIEELTLRGEQAIQTSGALQQYPYAYTVASGTDGLGIWSKSPLRDTSLIASAGFPSLRAETTILGRNVVLYAIHTRAPVNGYVSYWHADLTQIRHEIRHETLPVIAAGDYNATWQHRPFRQLLGSQFQDAAAVDGRGYARTWPLDLFGGNYVGGLIRLDHVVVSEQLVVRGSAELHGGGSDHRAITADLAFRP